MNDNSVVIFRFEHNGAQVRMRAAIADIYQRRGKGRIEMVGPPPNLELSPGDGTLKHVTDTDAKENDNV